MIMRYVGVAVFTIILLAGCATVPTQDIEIEAQADPKANFSGYKTYDWIGSAAIVNDPHGHWEPPQFDADAEIVFLIDRELRKRGMSRSAIRPDMMVAYAAGIDMDVLKLKVDPVLKIEMAENVPQGGLVVVLVDNESGFVIWAGGAVADIQQNPSIQTVKARMNYAVTKMFKELPK